MQVRVFSRNCEDRSGQFPDVAQQVLAAAQGEAGAAPLRCRRCGTGAAGVG